MSKQKKLPFPEILSKLGYEPVKIEKGGYELWYLSPFRKEAEPSFHTSFLGEKWIWNDFGDIGGTIIDFIMRHEGYYKIGDALSFLDKMNLRSFQKKEKIKPRDEFALKKTGQKSQLEFVDDKDITHPSIISYLSQERKIKESIFRKYLKEIRYKNLATGKEYFAFGILNNSGGYEIRVASDQYPFKSSLIQKDITHISGFKTGQVVNLFEGMTDFLSLLTMMKTDNLAGDSILMHSLSSFEKTVTFIKNKDYQVIHTYLDNNDSGIKSVKQFQEAFDSKILDEGPLFLPFEDLNEALIASI